MDVLTEQMTRPETSSDAQRIALGEERVAAWARFYAISADSTPGEVEYDRALAAAKKLDAEIVEIVNAEPVARICVIASQGHRGDKLHLYEDARLLASELNREWPSIEHWAAPATADELRTHASQAARLRARTAGGFLVGA
jgi:hypothetical protein